MVSSGIPAMMSPRSDRHNLGARDRLRPAGPPRAFPARFGYRAGMNPDHYTLAGSDVTVPALGVGTWAWGDRSTWGMGGYDTDLTRDSIREAWEASIDAGVTLFDTAEVYGGGESERIIGSLLAADPGRAASVVVATKFMPSPWKLQVRSALLRSLRASLERLGLSVGRPVPDPRSDQPPLARRPGRRPGRRPPGRPGGGGGCLQLLGRRRPGPWPARSRAGACDWPPTRSSSRCCGGPPRPSGLLAACRDLGVLPLAYSPIGQGRLTGKYSAANPPPGKRTFSNHPMEVVDRVVAELRRIGEKHGGKLPSQVALNWVMAKGAVPIPGAKNRHQAEENAGALGWTIDEEDLARLDRVALPGIRTVAEPPLAARLSRTADAVRPAGPGTGRCVRPRGRSQVTCMEPSTVSPWRTPLLDHSITMMPRPTRVPGGAKESATGAGT